jgi:hypothetical protein
MTLLNTVAMRMAEGNEQFAQELMTAYEKGLQALEYGLQLLPSNRAFGRKYVYFQRQAHRYTTAPVLQPMYARKKEWLVMYPPDYQFGTSAAETSEAATTKKTKDTQASGGKPGDDSSQGASATGKEETGLAQSIAATEAVGASDKVSKTVRIAQAELADAARIATALQRSLERTRQAVEGYPDFNDLKQQLMKQHLEARRYLKYLEEIRVRANELAANPSEGAGLVVDIGNLPPEVEKLDRTLDQVWREYGGVAVSSREGAL